MNNRFRQALLERKVTKGAWIQIAHPACAEILADAGFDWLCVDLEHGVADLESLAGLFRAVERSGCTPVARVPYNDAIWIKRSLDAGAQGLIVPMVNSREEAERALAEAKYPPRGRRGFGYCRANLYGAGFASYAATANEEIAVVLQVEHKDAIANLEGILAVPDVDALFIGPMDLSGSFGKPGDLGCPEMTAALECFLRACRAHGKSAGLHVIAPDQASIGAALASGYTMIAAGLDTTFLAAGARDAVRAFE